MLSIRKEAELSARKEVFGGRSLFEKLRRKHLNGKDREGSSAVEGKEAGEPLFSWRRQQKGEPEPAVHVER